MHPISDMDAWHRWTVHFILEVVIHRAPHLCKKECIAVVEVKNNERPLRRTSVLGPEGLERPHSSIIIFFFLIELKPLSGISQMDALWLDPTRCGAYCLLWLELYRIV